MREVTVAPNYLKSHTDSWYRIFFQKKICLMSGLKFALSDLTSFLPDNLSGLKKYTFKQWPNDFPVDFVCNIAIYAYDTTL